VETQLPMFSWVEDRRDRITFGLQAVPMPRSPRPGHQVIEAALLAEKLGLDAFYVPDHPAWAPEAWVHLAAIAVSTENIRLGTVVSSIGYRSPTHLARLAADTDQLSDGRLVLGLGIGWDVDEFDRLGVKMASVPERQRQLEEAVQTIRAVWRGEPDSDNHPFLAPKEASGPPIMIAGSGKRVTLRQVAAYADACNFGPSETTGSVRTPDDARASLSVLRRHCDDLGRPIEDILPTHFTSWLLLAETEVAAQAKLARYYPDGLTDIQRFTRVATTPEGAIAYYQALADAGIRHFVVQSQDAMDHETYRLLAEAVAPQVKVPVPKA
jgi:alkanesulfonate monooxygenase SsuD/methylene tetrahydromethanopterin reductase-like flavin-dependent oxidoreductase (luciferase family)